MRWNRQTRIIFRFVSRNYTTIPPKDLKLDKLLFQNSTINSMKNAYPYFLLLLFFIVGITTQSLGQSIGGKITNDKGEPIPFANIFVKETQEGTVTDDEGNYFIKLEVKGEYELIVSSVGYVTQSMTLIVGDEAFTKDFRLKADVVNIDEIVVKASKKDSSYAIIRKVIENKKKYLASVQSFKSEVYVKATEVVNRQKKPNQKKKEEAKKKKEDEKKKERPKEDIDGFEKETMDQKFDKELTEAQKANQKLLSSLNMIEMQLTLNYQYPKKYKEERTAYKKSGSKAGLFIPLFGETDFNFYRNMVRLEGISDAPLISPISSTSILYYKYKLMETRKENGQIVYKIKVIPRKTGNSTCSGYIYINEGIWNINRLDFDFHKGGLKFFDAFNLKLEYANIEDTLWIPARQEFVYETKEGRFKTFKGNTVMKYSDYQHNYEFPRRFFSNEVVLTTREALDRDSTYWNELRPEPLKEEEARVLFLRDSVKAVINSKEYQDSITAAYNKVTFLELVWDGMGWRNNEKKTHTFIGPIPSLVNYSLFGGWRVNPYIYRSKRWDGGRRGSMSANVSYGFKNEDLQGNIDGWFRYNPHRLADVRFSLGRNIQSINPFDAFLNQLRFSNYIINEGIDGSHRIELFNGFYFRTYFSYNNRRSLNDFNANSELATWIDQWTPVVDEVIDFEDYQALITNISFSYTPGQKFMTQPDNKIILGSKFPTFSVRYKKGWNKIFSSDINFDYWEIGLSHDLTIGALGNSKYTAKAGTFTNTKQLNYVDLKRFRQSDPILYSSPLHSFQALDTSLATTNWFFEVHHIHHFNGALVNNIPLIKKTNIRFIVGGGFMYVKENNLRHEEIFGGIERVFKLGARRRLRIGLYGVLANGNYRDTGVSYKISFDVIDTWKKDWNF